MKYLVWSLVVVLIILHQDFWNWDNADLVFGFLPVTLLYQVCISLGAGITWFLAVQFAWPQELEYIEQQLEEKKWEDK
ncbi:DUF3311 domain-containing protein [Blastopirellula marina]|uniref:DUF3311 domain-containing protein n=1 Tax=Blastopirellula marina TaxID=124 RepID=A0A2S8GFD0_9BACT|nr:DUF3311 domain-containing protein [Blastopirellula marina]PQO43133.1 hypothetical protein C5Y93_25845 [Blastopirellula marina]